MKKLRLLTLSLVLSLPLSLANIGQAWANSPAPIKTPSQVQFLDGIAAVVNDHIILQSELQERTEDAYKALQARQIHVDNLQALKRKVLDKMILERLQLERAHQLGLTVSDEEVLDQMRQIAQKNHLTLLQLRDQLNLQTKAGFQKFRNDIRQQLLIQKLRQEEVISKTQVTEGEINNYLKRKSLQNNTSEYHLQHLMIALPEGSTPQQRAAAKAKAQKMLDRLKQGEDFSQLAVRYSNGPNALEGGDLGWLTMDAIPTFFANSVEVLPKNQISSLIQSPVGFHIIKLLGKREKGSQLVKQYDLYQFIILSDDALTAQTPPPALVKLAKSIHSLNDFQTLNARYSDIPASVNQHGHLGWKTPNQLNEKEAQALMQLPHPKMASKPIATHLGWKILYLNGIRNKDINEADKRLKALQAIRAQKANETFAIWLRRLKEEAIIDNRLQPQKTQKAVK